MIGRNKIKKVSSYLGEPIRFFSMRFVLSPAASFLPRKWALAAADVVALLLCLLPEPGHYIQQGMKKAFGVNKHEAFHLAWGWLARPLRDFVACKRLISGRGAHTNLKIIEKNSEPISALRNSGESYIIACGHFTRETLRGMYLPRVTPGHIFAATVPLAPRTSRMYDLRIRLQLATLFKAGYAAHGGNLTFVFTGSDSNAAGTLYANLCKPGNVAVINIDAPFKSGGAGFFSRPFAGLRNRVFSMGAVRLARLAQCAIVSCISWQESDGTIVLDWGEPIILASRGGKAEDILIMNKLLDRFEVAIGRRPTQYVLDIESERRWDSQVEQWLDF